MGKPATVAQFTALKEIWKATGGDKVLLQQKMDDGSVKDVFKEWVALQNDIRIIEFSTTVRQDEDFIVAMEKGGLSTPEQMRSVVINTAGDKHPPTSDKEEEVAFVLLNFPKSGGNWDRALKWAKTNGCEKTNPRELFAVAGHPDFRDALNYPPNIKLFATIDYPYVGRVAVYVNVGLLVREVGVDWLSLAWVHPEVEAEEKNRWFLFRK